MGAEERFEQSRSYFDALRLAQKLVHIQERFEDTARGRSSERASTKEVLQALPKRRNVAEVDVKLRFRAVLSCFLLF